MSGAITSASSSVQLPGFTQPLTGYRMVTVQKGDSLISIAARELKDASQWPNLETLNGLNYPWITDDPGKITATVLGPGSQIKIPSTAPQVAGVADTSSVFGADAALDDDGFLDVDPATGDLLVVSGVDNLVQALENRLDTPPGQLVYHLDYGFRGYELIGKGNSPTVGLLAANWVSQALMADPRISSVENPVAIISGDSVAPSATAITVNGKYVPVGVTNVPN